MSEIQKFSLLSPYENLLSISTAENPLSIPAAATLSSIPTAIYCRVSTLIRRIPWKIRFVIIRNL